MNRTPVCDICGLAFTSGVWSSGAPERFTCAHCYLSAGTPEPPILDAELVEFANAAIAGLDAHQNK